MIVYSEFYEQLSKAVSFFNSYNDNFSDIDSDVNNQVKIVTHYDSDGLCAAAIISKALDRKNISYSISVLPQLDVNSLNELSKENNSFYIFTDIGSTYVAEICEIFSKKKVLIIDHHRTKNIITSPNVFHLNPHLNKINGSKEISGAGVVYLFAEKLDEINKDLSHLAIVGAIGDCQEHYGFYGLNDIVLKTAIAKGILSVKKGLCLYGSKTKPLFKLLKQCHDPHIKGVSGSFEGTREFLLSLGIESKKQIENQNANNSNGNNTNNWKMLSDLDEDEIDKLTQAIMERIQSNKKKRLVANVYTLPKEEGSFRDAREFSTILNSCGRLDKSMVGIGAALGNKEMQNKAVDILSGYKKEILRVLTWFKENRNTTSVIESDYYVIINAKDNITPSIAGTFSSIISYSGDMEKGKYILTMSRMDDDNTKISLRVVGGTHGTDIDLHRALKEMLKAVNGQGGGHKNAAGAIILTSKEDDFIKSAITVFDDILKNNNSDKNELNRGEL